MDIAGVKVELMNSMVKLDGEAEVGWREPRRR